MATALVKKKAIRLRAQIDDLRYRYHVLNDPEVTDKMYEGLMSELRQLEAAQAELITPDSPTQRIAGQPLEKFEKVAHQVPQWSFNDAFTEADLNDWRERIFNILEKKLGQCPRDLDYICELKIDGLHMVLTYAQGQLRTAATRGDGRVGEDVTQNIKTIHSVPLTLKPPVDIVVEGEVWMSAARLKKINKQRAKNHEPLYANPRNVAAGTIRQLDPRVVAERKLVLTAYDISGGEIPATQAEELRRLKALGFKVDDHWVVAPTVSDIVCFWRSWEKKKSNQEFWVDGVVVKVNQKKYQDALGYTGKAPRWALALKFAAEQGVTKVKDIYVQVGRTGALTPVALMEPVRLAGTTVTHATLHNFDEIKRLDVRVGDNVVVEKAGEIIPKVVRVLEKLRTGEEKRIREPRLCPICQSTIERRSSGIKRSVALYCTNAKCYAQTLEKIIHFVAKGAFDIDGLGQKIVEQFLNVGLIKNPADIFTLTTSELVPLERFAKKSADNLISAIHKAKRVTLPRLLFALGIDQVGEETAIRLADHFGSLAKIIKATRAELEAVADVGPKVAEAIAAYFADQANVRQIETLKRYGVKVVSHNSNFARAKLAGKVFVLTGNLESMTRAEAKEKIRALGGSVSGAVGQKTDYVVVGHGPGSKYDEAKRLGVKTIDEQELAAMMFN